VPQIIAATHCRTVRTEERAVVTSMTSASLILSLSSLAQAQRLLGDLDVDRAPKYSAEYFHH
jgi:hypothetical protein